MGKPLPITAKELADAADVSSGFASLVTRGLKPLPQRIAIKVWRKTGQKLGPIADATDEEIATLEKFQETGAPSDSPGPAA